MKIQWDKIPLHKIICANISSPREIEKYFKHHKIDWYVYELVSADFTITDVIKYGMSADKSRDYGERTYRQIGHCKSWGDQRIFGASGSDFLSINELWVERYGADINHKNIILTVFDLTNYPFLSTDKRKEIYCIEESLIYQYEQLHGRKPVGNLLEKYSYKDRAYVEEIRIKQLFIEDTV